jgi:hypothetical protein
MYQCIPVYTAIFQVYRIPDGTHGSHFPVLSAEPEPMQQDSDSTSEMTLRLSMWTETVSNGQVMLVRLETTFQVCSDLARTTRRRIIDSAAWKQSEQYLYAGQTLVGLILGGQCYHANRD